jgi:hypothetical protein
VIEAFLGEMFKLRLSCCHRNEKCGFVLFLQHTKAFVTEYYVVSLDQGAKHHLLLLSDMYYLEDLLRSEA